MVAVCNFFLKGTCKFGNNCHFEHPGSNRGGFVGRPNFGQQQTLNDRYHFTAGKGGGGTTNPSNNFQVDQNAILQAVRKELQEWDANNVWPLSCFAAEREKKCLPGLEDHSPEELRVEAYKYQEIGGFQTYVNELSNLSNQVMNRRNQLKTMSNDQLWHEMSLCNATSTTATTTTTTTTNLVSSNPFSNPSSNLFSTGFGASAQPSTGLFGSSTQATPAVSSSLFGTSSTQVGGLFSGNTASSTLNNPFVSSSSGGLFTNNTSTTSSFFGGVASTNVNPFLATASVAPSGGLFSSSATIAAAPTGGLFGSTPSSASVLPIPFGTPPASVTNPFGGTTNVSGSGGLFAQSKPSPGIFGSSTTTQVTTQVGKTDANPFLTSALNSQKPVEQPTPSTPPSNQASAYTSKLPQVTAADIEKFKAAKFVLGKIPTCPPPVELC